MNFLNSLFGGIRNLVGGMFNPASVGMSAGRDIGSNLAGSVLNMFTGGGRSATPATTSKPNLPSYASGQFGQFGSPASGALARATGGGGGGMPPILQSNPATQILRKLSTVSNEPARLASPSKAPGWIDNMFPGGSQGALLGAGITGLGQLFGKSPKAPSFNTPEVQSLQQFSQNPPVLPQSMQDEINKSLAIKEEAELRNLMNVYRNIRPGTDITTDSAYQRDLANLRRSQTSDRANALMGPTLTYQQTQYATLKDLADRSVEEIMLRTGMDAEEASNLKGMFGQIGGMFMLKSLYPQGVY